jgi:hypothetical protein
MVGAAPDKPWPLQSWNVAPDGPGVLAFLRDVRPDGQHGRRFEALVRQLGNDAFTEREEAMQRILAATIYYPHMLRKAATGGDAEVALRAAQLLQALPGAGTGQSYEQLLCVVYRAVAERKMPGLTAGLLDSVETTDDRRALWAATLALRVGAGKDDERTLREAAAAGSPQRRAAAARALAAVGGPAASEAIQRLVADADDRVKFYAALAASDLGDRRCLGALVALLESEDPELRGRSASALKALTGAPIVFVATAPPTERAERVRAWRAWVENEGRDAAMRTPIPQRIQAPQPGLVLWNRLGSQSEIESSEAGPAGQWNGKGTFVGGVYGNAIELGGDQQLALSFPADVISPEAGCIELWAQLVAFPPALEWGQRPAFFTADGLGIILYLNGNDGCARGGLCANAGRAGGCGTGPFGAWKYEAVLGEGRIGDWHHYALVWNLGGIPGIADGKQTVAVFLNGRLHASARNDGGAGPPPKGGRLALMRNQGGVGRVRLDDLKVWNWAKTDFADRFEGDEMEELRVKAH